MISGLYHKIKNANADDLRRWRFVFWLSFGSFSLLSATVILLVGYRTANGQQLATRQTAPAITHPTVGAAPLVAVMIDNALEARPQSGLNLAPLVVEAPVEGGYTRFAAFFNSDVDVKTIGPVRSVRPYFIDLAKGFGAAIAHIGGSPEAMDQIQTYPYGNIDGIKSDCCNWRSADRFAPHNAYTSIALLKNKIAAVASAPDIRYQSAGKVPVGDSALGVTIEFAKNVAKTSWRYNPILGGYIRSQGNDVLKDALDEKPVMTENIAIMKTNIEVIDSEARRSIDTLSGGEALILLGGKAIHGSWSRVDNGPVVFKDADGNVMQWNPGRLWIEVVDTSNEVTIL